MDKYPSFPKIARLNRDIVVSEKLDGTNSQIEISESPDGALVIRAGSRNRWIVPHDDNHGFAAWVEDNKSSLIDTLGVGNHFGEWWGRKIARGYDKTDRTFSLFNTSRWTPESLQGVEGLSVVPVLWTGSWDGPGMSGSAQEDALFRLKQDGSLAAPGFMRPEGIVIFHTASNMMFKVTIENDEKPKGQP